MTKMIKRCECGHGKSYHKYMKNCDFNVCEGLGYPDNMGLKDYGTAICQCAIGFAEDPSRIGIEQLWTEDYIRTGHFPTKKLTAMEIGGNKNNPFRCERDDTMTWHDVYDKDEPDFADNNGYCIFDPELAKGGLAVDDKRCWDHIADPTIKYCKGGCGTNLFRGKPIGGEINKRQICQTCVWIKNRDIEEEKRLSLASLE
jgi:hypothetical protein